MQRYVYIILSIGIIALKTSTAGGQQLIGKENNPIEILGEATNGLQPHLFIERNTDWNIEIDFIAQTNFSRFAWLKTTNRIGSKLQLWLTSGMELQSTNSNFLAARSLPSQATVSRFELDTPTIAPAVPMKIERRSSFSAIHVPALLVAEPLQNQFTARNGTAILPALDG